MAGKKRGFIPRRKVANNPIELAVSLISAAVTVGSIVQMALEKSREYKAEQRKREQENGNKTE